MIIFYSTCSNLFNNSVNLVKNNNEVPFLLFHREKDNVVSFRCANEFKKTLSKGMSEKMMLISFEDKCHNDIEMSDMRYKNFQFMRNESSLNNSV